MSVGWLSCEMISMLLECILGVKMNAYYHQILLLCYHYGRQLTGCQRRDIWQCSSECKLGIEQFFLYGRVFFSVNKILFIYLNGEFDSLFKLASTPCYSAPLPWRRRFIYYEFGKLIRY